MKFIYFVLQSSVLILLVLLIQKIARKKLSAKLLYALWLIPLIRLMLPFGFLPSMSHASQPNIFTYPYVVFENTATRITQIGQNSDQNIDQSVIIGDNENVEQQAVYSAQGSNQNNQGIQISDVYSSELQPADIQLTDIKNSDAKSSEIQNQKNKVNAGQINASQADNADSIGVVQNQDAQRNNSFVESMNNIVPFIQLVGIMVWICGSMVLFIVMIYQNKRMKGFLCLLDREQIEEDGVFSGTQCRIAIYEGTKSISPCVFGIVHPCIVLTNEIYEDKQLLKHVLKHEQTHMKHNDQIWSLCRVLSEIIYWWNPLVWIGAKHAAEAAEYACDEAVIRNYSQNERKEYGNTLLSIVQQNCQKNKLLAATSMIGNRTELEKRIMNMVHPARTVKWYAIPILAVLCVVLITGCSSTSAYSNEIAGNDMNSQSENDSDHNEFVYIQDISNSLKAIDRYKYAENEDFVTETIIFSNDCKYFNDTGDEIDFHELSSIVNTNYKENGELTKCRLIFDEKKKFVTEIYIEEQKESKVGTYEHVYNIRLLFTDDKKIVNYEDALNPDAKLYGSYYISDDCKFYDYTGDEIDYDELCNRVRANNKIYHKNTRFRLIFKNLTKNVIEMYLDEELDHSILEIPLKMWEHKPSSVENAQQVFADEENLKINTEDTMRWENDQAQAEISLKGDSFKLSYQSRAGQINNVPFLNDKDYLLGSDPIFYEVDTDDDGKNEIYVSKLIDKGLGCTKISLYQLDCTDQKLVPLFEKDFTQKEKDDIYSIIEQWNRNGFYDETGMQIESGYFKIAVFEPILVRVDDKIMVRVEFLQPWDEICNIKYHKSFTAYYAFTEEGLQLDSLTYCDD